MERSSRQRWPSRQGSFRLRSRRQPGCASRKAGYTSNSSTGNCLRARWPPPERSDSAPEPQRHACQRRDVPRARRRLSARARRRPRGIRLPDCRTDRQPAVRGDDRAHGRSLILPEGRVSLAGWTGRLEVTGDTVAAAALRGQVNGGDVSLNGTVTRRGTAQASPLTITARNVFLEIPRGLRSELNADLTWRNQSGRAALSGTATITADPRNPRPPWSASCRR